MPSVSGYSSTTNSIQWMISGLMYPAYQYSNFQIELWRGSTHIETMNWSTDSGQTYTMQTSYGLSANTTYRAKAWSRYLNGPSTYMGETSYSTENIYVPPPDPYPDSISYVSLSSSSTESGKISAYWPHANYATNYRVEVYRYGSSNPVTTFSTYGDNYADVYGLLEDTRYEVKVYGQNSRGNGGAAWNDIWTAKMRDTTPPVISGLNIDGNGHIYVYFSGYDSDSGMRYTSTYYTEISNAGGTSYGMGSYSTNAWRTFTTNGQGGNLVNGSTYTVRITAYDNENNWAQRTISGVYKQARPLNFSWHSSKITGNAINITASEWNSFCTRVSEFSVYKTGSSFSYTSAYTGQAIAAALCNLTRSKIASMGAAVPTAASTGNAINASYFNGLVSSLNSIT